MLSAKGQTEYYKSHDSIYMKYPAKANLQRQKADQWSLRAGGGSRNKVKMGWRELSSVKKHSKAGV